MIEFGNKADRELLRKLVALPVNNSCLGDFIATTVLGDRAIIIYTKEHRLQLVTDRKNDNCDIFCNDLLTCISLIEYLRNNNLIFIHQNPDLILNENSISFDEKNTHSVLCGIKNFQQRITEDYSQFSIINVNTVFDYIVEYTSSFVYVRSELRDYVNNNFKSLEYERFRGTILWTRIAVIISFIGLIAAITLPFISRTQIDKKQYDNLIRVIHYEKGNADN